MSSRRAVPPRLWPAGLILAATVATLAGTWMPFDRPVGMSQTKVTVIALFAAALLLLVWWLFFSRTGFFTRLASMLALFAFAVTASLVVEYRGLSGDLVPRFGWRGGAAPVPPETKEKTPAPAPTPSPSGSPDANRAGERR